MSATAVDRLRRFVNRSTDLNSCDLCRSELTDRHRHLLEVANQKMLCACDACELLFSNTNGSRFRPIPQSVTSVDLKLSDAEWSGLGIPIGMAFFTVRDKRRSGPDLEKSDDDCQDRSWPTFDSHQSSITVAYPSPAGPMMSSVEQDDWQALVDTNPQLNRLRPEVESLLIKRTASRHQSFIVPLDVCFELIGIVRRNWQGVSGGPDVHREIDRFFDHLEQSAGKGVRS